MVPGAGIEPAQPQGPRDFKSLASTNSATQADDEQSAGNPALILFLICSVKNSYYIYLIDNLFRRLSDKQKKIC